MILVGTHIPSIRLPSSHLPARSALRRDGGAFLELLYLRLIIECASIEAFIGDSARPVKWPLSNPSPPSAPSISASPANASQTVIFPIGGILDVSEKVAVFSTERCGQRNLNGTQCDREGQSRQIEGAMHLVRL